MASAELSSEAIEQPFQEADGWLTRTDRLSPVDLLAIRFLPAGDLHRSRRRLRSARHVRAASWNHRRLPRYFA
jgi:hypothetical protein